MISINLIPNVKQELLRAQHQRTAVISIAITVGIVAVAVVVVLGVIVGGQKLYSAQLDNEIDNKSASLLSTPDLTNMLTLQNQLGKIDTINDAKNIDSRLFDILVATNPPAPNNISISSVVLDPDLNTITIIGQTPSGYSALEVFTKTIAATKISYTSDDGSHELDLTDEITIEQQGFGENAEGQKVVTFTLSFIYPNEVFAASSKNASIKGPNSSQNVTDSYVRLPESLFTNPAQTSEEGSNGN